MKDITVLLLLSIKLWGCENTVKEELKFSVLNSSNLPINKMLVALPDTTLTYELLNKNSQSDWILVGSAYNYGFIKFFDNENREYYFQPIDYVGERLYTKGSMKFIITDIDTLKQTFELDSEYKTE